MNTAQHILIAGIQAYRWVLSPAKVFLFGPAGRCRYSPSCSEYALGCVQQHGAVKGLWLGLKRIGRCHPWGGCGWDPVPQRNIDGACECCVDANHFSHEKLPPPRAENLPPTARFSANRGV